MTDTILLERIDSLTSAVLLMAKMSGARLTRTQLCERLGIHRNTLRAKALECGFPKPDVSGKWLLAEIIEWEQR